MFCRLAGTVGQRHVRESVQKGKEKWEIARDKDTKIVGDLKVGSKVTIHYKMKATSVEVKEEKKKK